ncbi:MAG: ribosome silencing factor [Caldilineae bacterium]|nr:MAG: ribosome silencing factor [Caldilineae bacterium]
MVEIVEEKQAQDIVLLDVSEQTSIADYFIIATVDTERQANAIREELHKALHLQQKVRPLNMEGVEGGGGGWVLVDYGDVILHLFTAETRAYYDLEGLWSKATVVMKMI